MNKKANPLHHMLNPDSVAFVGSDIEVTTRKLHQFKIPAYDGPEKAVTAMSAMVRYRWILDVDHPIRLKKMVTRPR